MKLLGWMCDGVSAAVCAGAEVTREHPGKSLFILVSTVGVGAAAFVAAPAVGALVSAAGFGVGGGTLSGAAASSAGLAALGGGSLAAGGAGVAGGTAVVTAGGAATGAVLSGGALALTSAGAREGEL